MKPVWIVILLLGYLVPVVVLYRLRESLYNSIYRQVEDDEFRTRVATALTFFFILCPVVNFIVLVTCLKIDIE